MKLKISYYLKSGKFTLFPVMALISFGYAEFDVVKGTKVYRPLRYYTPLKVGENEWDVAKKMPKSKALINELANFEKTVEETYQYIQLKGDSVTPDSFKHELDKRFGKKEEIDILRIRIVDYIDDNLLNVPNLNKNSAKRLTQYKKKILDFEKKIGKPLFAKDVDENMYLLFMDFIRGKVERNNALVSYMRGFIAVLRKIGRTYKITVFNPSKELNKKDIPRATIEDKVYLKFDEIQKVLEYKPRTDRMKNIRLIFLTLLFTGCRYGDVFKVRNWRLFKKGTDKFNYCQFITNKNQKEVVIPILKPLQDAFKENGGEPAKKIFLSDFDAQVKVLAKECGLNKKHSLSYTDSSGKTKLQSKPFYEFVSSHTGRRSFITNLINYVPITMLCKITTHELKDQSIIFIYNKITLLDNAVLFMRHLLRARSDYKDAFPFSLV